MKKGDSLNFPRLSEGRKRLAAMAAPILATDETNSGSARKAQREAVAPDRKEGLRQLREVLERVDALDEESRCALRLALERARVMRDFDPLFGGPGVQVLQIIPANPGWRAVTRQQRSDETAYTCEHPILAWALILRPFKEEGQSDFETNIVPVTATGIVNAREATALATDAGRFFFGIAAPGESAQDVYEENLFCLLSNSVTYEEWLELCKKRERERRT